MQKVYAFTGTPGTGVQTSIRRLQDYLRKHGTSSEYICLDTYVWEAFVDEFAGTPPHPILEALNFDVSEVQKTKKPNWFKLLNLPADKIRLYWAKAAGRALAEIKDSSESLFLISFHANYYSDDYRWRFCAVNFALLKQFNFEAFFVLIDEIYEVLERRDDIRTIFGEAHLIENKLDRVEVFVKKTIEYLENYILWRQEEIAQTDLFAYSCGSRDEFTNEYRTIPSHVFSVKHPLATLRRLVENPNFSVYFSHPITDIRADPGFPNNVSLAEIDRISRELRDQLTLIEPTAIDELRIHNLRYQDYFPSLTPRWKQLGEPDAVVLPGDNRGTFCETIRNLGVEDEFNAICNRNDLKGLEKELQERVSNAIHDFCENIKNDITWRDYHLVDQTRRLIVYRPCFNGRPSLGVQSEVEYYERVKLTGTGQTNIQVVVYHPKEDDEMTQTKLANEVIDSLASQHDFAVSLGANQLNENRVKLSKEIGAILQSMQLASQAALEIIEAVNRTVPFKPITPVPSIPLAQAPRSRMTTEVRGIMSHASEMVERQLRRRYYVAFLEKVGQQDLTMIRDGGELRLFDAIRQIQG